MLGAAGMNHPSTVREGRRARNSVKESTKNAERTPGQDTIRLGVGSRPLTDIYHFLLTSPWWVLFGLMFLSYLGANAVFALLYWLEGGVEGARAGNFGDAYFFSVQTMATIGYGKMTPQSTFSNIVVTIEALVGLVGLARAFFSAASPSSARAMASGR
jgi:inward rectifier potassium channel